MTGIFKEVTIAIIITSKVKHQCLPFSNIDFLSREKFTITYVDVHLPSEKGNSPQKG